MERGVARRDSARATPTKQQQKRNDKKKNATNNQANKKKNTMNISYSNYLILEKTHCYVSIEMFIFANTGKAIL